MKYLLSIFDANTSEVFGHLVFESSTELELVTVVGSCLVFRVKDYVKIDGTLNPAYEGVVLVLDIKKCVCEFGESSGVQPGISLSDFDSNVGDLQDQIQKGVKEALQARAEYEEREKRARERVRGLLDSWFN